MPQTLLSLTRNAVRITLLALVLLALALIPQSPLRAQLDAATPRPVAPAPVAPAAVSPAAISPATVNVVVPLSGVTSIAAGAAHTCATTLEGLVYCWGLDSNGQIGDGPENSVKLLPVPVVNLTNATTVRGGFRFTCAVGNGGGAFCWGEGSKALPGDIVEDSNEPIAVPGLSSITDLSAGGSHTCAVTSAGALFCWGLDFAGQLGNGEPLQSSFVPVGVDGLSSGVSKVAAGRTHTCALLVDGNLRCWGANDNTGQLGIGPLFGTFPIPEPVLGITNTATAVAAGTAHSCALLNTGNVLCWGDNVYGQVGYGAINQDYYTPGEVTGITDATAIASGGNHACAILEMGDVACWGRDSSGQLGDGAITPEPGVLDPAAAPSAVVGLAASAVALAAGDNHTCALLETGVMQCWGSDFAGQLGNDLFQAGSAVPVTVTVALTCHALTRSASGPGADPQVAPAASLGCPDDHFVAGRTVQLTAAPAPGARVREWSTPPGAAPGVTTASFTMPAGDASVSITYEACSALTTSAIGNGQPLVAIPDRSPGCAEGQFGVGEQITLTANPSANHRVKAWSETSVAPAVGQLNNTVTMPAGPRTVTVTYEACHQLTTTLAGAGQPIVVAPSASSGCPAQRYVAGEALALTAAPASGSLVAFWSGTLSDTSTNTTNQAVMPSGPKSVGVTYAPQETPTPVPPPADGPKIYLPSVKR